MPPPSRALLLPIISTALALILAASVSGWSWRKQILGCIPDLGGRIWYGPSIQIPMAKPAAGSIPLLNKRFVLFVVVILSVSTVLVCFIRGASAPCDPPRNGLAAAVDRAQLPRHSDVDVGARKNPLGFMRTKLVLLVSHELSLSGIFFFFFFGFLDFLDLDYYSSLELNRGQWSTNLCFYWLIPKKGDSCRKESGRDCGQTETDSHFRCLLHMMFRDAAQRMKYKGWKIWGI